MPDPTPSGAPDDPSATPRPAPAPPTTATPAYELEVIESEPAPRREVPSWQLPPPASTIPVEPLVLDGSDAPPSAPALESGPRAPVAAPPTWQQVMAGSRGDEISVRRDGRDDGGLHGTGQDLWECPHCQARNKPERTHCRQCGKSPLQAKEPAWWSRPEPILGVLIGAVLVTIVVMSLLHTDLGVKPPIAASVDWSPRLGGTVSLRRDFPGGIFEAKGRIAVCGRVLAARSMPVKGIIGVVLALGTDASDKAIATKETSRIQAVIGEDAVQTSAGHWVLLHLITTDNLDLGYGAYLSLAGDYGEVSEGGQLIKGLAQPNSFIVLPGTIRQ